MGYCVDNHIFLDYNRVFKKSDNFIIKIYFEINFSLYSFFVCFLLHLFGLVGFYLASSSAVCFSVFSFCFTLSPSHRLHVRSSHCFCCLPLVAKVGSVGCVGFLVEGTSACVLDLVFLVGRTLSGGMFWGVCDLIMILGSLSANG